MTTPTTTLDPVATRWRYLERERIAIFRELAAEFIYDEDIDYNEFVRAQARRLGISEHEAKQGMDATYTLRNCPKFTSLVDEGLPVSMSQLGAITSAITSAPHHPQRDQLTDEILVAKVESLREDQTLPAPSTLRRGVSRTLRRALADLGVKDEEPDTPVAKQKNQYFCDGHGNLGLFTTPATSTMIDQIVGTLASKEGLSKADALIKLLTDKVDLKVTINLFGVPKETDTPVQLFVHGAGQLTQIESQWAEKKTSRYTDLSRMGLSFSKDVHDASPALRKYLLARDGGCRYPDCDQTENLQLHHVTAFERGGPTTASNLVCLCHRHHNLITGNIIRLYMTETGTCLWMPQIGPLSKTYPQGPLGEKQRFQFVRSEEDHMEAKGRFWRWWARRTEKPKKQKQEEDA